MGRARRARGNGQRLRSMSRLPIAARLLAVTTRQDMTMSKTKLKLMSAGIVVAVAIGAITLRVARATPPRGVTATLVAGPVTLDEADVKSNEQGLKIKIQTKGDWASRIMRYNVAPGGTFGWHSHPGPCILMVTAGTLTSHEADGSTEVYPQGTGFVHAAGEVHTAGNEGTTPLELFVMFLTPEGESPRIDEPQP
jgi:quercetin dioxygenase-like cupin family protein